MNIREYLTLSGFSIRKFARLCEINHQSAHNYLNEVQRPSLRSAKKIAARTEYKITVEELRSIVPMPKNPNSKKYKKYKVKKLTRNSVRRMQHDQLKALLSANM